MNKPRLLDAFCGAGGCSMGYHRAGFEVMGVDIEPQPHYPFEFVQADAIEYIREHGHEFDVIHASPPCQAYSVTKSLHSIEHPDLVAAVREAILLTGKPYAIENVKGAPLRNPVVLCGSSFGLGVWRHRLFETRPDIWFRPLCEHKRYPKPIDVTGGGRQIAPRKKKTGGQSRKPRNLEQARQAMGIGWMSRKELNQAIPPAYTEWLGKQLLATLEAQR